MKNINKKYLIGLVTLVSMLSVSLVQASTVSLTPSTVTVQAGQTVTVNVVINSATDKVVTVKNRISYPTNLLRPTSFVFAPSWIQVNKTGYDYMDGGVVVKTAGFPGGFTGSKSLGTLTFTAIGSGTGNISVLGDSLALNPQNTNVYSGGVASSVVTVTPGVPGLETPGLTQGENGTTGAVSKGTNETSSSATNNNNALAAAAADASPNIFTSAWFWLVIVLVIVVIGIVWFVRRKNNNLPQ